MEKVANFILNCFLILYDILCVIFNAAAINLFLYGNYFTFRLSNRF